MNALSDSNIIFSSLKRLMGILPGFLKRDFRLLGVMYLFNSILELTGITSLLPLMLASLSDDSDSPLFKFFSSNYGITDKFEVLVILSCISIFLLISKTLFNLFLGRYEAQFSYKVQRYICINLHYQVFSRSLDYFKSKNTNDIFRDIYVIPGFFISHIVLGLLKFINEFFIFVLIITGLFIYKTSVVLSLVVLVLPVTLFSYRIVKKKSAILAENMNGIGQDLFRSIYTSLGGFIDVILTNSTGQFIDYHLNKQNEIIENKKSDFVIRLLPAKIIEMSTMLFIVGIVLIGTYFYKNSNEVLGVLVALGLGAYKLLPSLNRMMLALVGIKGHQYTFETVEKVRDEYPNSPKLEALEFKERVQLEKICFSYLNSDKVVLNELSLKIAKGQRIGIIGPSGSGKTTLINILIGLLEPTKGHIKLDDTPINHENLASYRNKLGYVQQDFFLADASLAENIAFGRKGDEIDEARVLECIEICQLQDLLDSLPSGIKTPVGERGSLFSGRAKTTSSHC